MGGWWKIGAGLTFISVKVSLCDIKMGSLEAEQLTKEDYEILAAFRYTLRKFLGFSEKAASDCGVSAQQYQVLLAIEGFPGRNRLTVGELAEQMQVTQHSVVGMVNRMEASGLLKRVRCDQDRRQVWVMLTDKGRKVLESLYRVHREELRLVAPRLMGFLRKASLRKEVIEPERRENASPVCYAADFEDLEESD